MLYLCMHIFEIAYIQIIMFHFINTFKIILNLLLKRFISNNLYQHLKI